MKPTRSTEWYAVNYELCTDGPNGQMEIATFHHECEYGPNPLPGLNNAAWAAECLSTIERLLKAYAGNQIATLGNGTAFRELLRLRQLLEQKE